MARGGAGGGDGAVVLDVGNGSEQVLERDALEPFASAAKVDFTPSAGVREGWEAKRPVTVLFNQVSWSICSRRQDVELIHSVTGKFRPATLSALMGASGSGKSSFLDILAKRKTVGTVQGQILYNGKAPSSRFLKRHVGYVEQNCALIPNLTCHEILLYTAALQQSRRDAAWRRDNVELVMRELGLSHRRDVIVGSQLEKGLSGGESKRVSIALAMFRGPEVLFLDEPTSGLDSASANSLMRLLKNLSEQNRTVVAAIHSPTAYSFSLVDTLLVLADGKVAYMGAPSQVEALWMSSFNLGDNCGRSPGMSTCEWLVDMLADRTNLAKITEGYRLSALAEENLGEVKAELASSQQGSPIVAKGSPPGDRGKGEKGEDEGEELRGPSLLKQVGVLLRWRAVKNCTSSAPEFLGARWADKLLFMLVMISLYYGKGESQGNAMSQLQAVPSVLFMVVILPAFGAAGYMPSLMLERPIFIRERADGNYSTLGYLLYKVSEEFLVSIPISALFAVGIYFGVKLHGSFALFFLMQVLLQNIGIILAYLVASFAPTVDFANALLPAYIVICLFFVGLLLPFDEIPDYWTWFSYICFLRYGWSGLMMNEYGGATGAMAQVPSFFNVSLGNPWVQFGYCCAFYPAFFLLTFLFMRFMRYTKR